MSTETSTNYGSRSAALSRTDDSIEWIRPLNESLNNGDLALLERETVYRPPSPPSTPDFDQNYGLQFIQLDRVRLEQGNHAEKLIKMYSYARAKSTSPFSEPVLAQIELRLREVLPNLSDRKIKEIFKKYRFYRDTHPLIEEVVESNVDPLLRVRREMKYSFCSTSAMPGYVVAGLFVALSGVESLISSKDHTEKSWAVFQLTIGVTLLAVPILRAITGCCVPKSKMG